MRIAILFAVVFTVAAMAFADDKPKDTSKDKPKEKPTIKVLADGFPSGHDSPEGVACDLARSFIKRDAKLFETICIPPFGGGEMRTEYETFLKKMVEELKKEADRKEPSPGGPKAIAKVFASRHLSNNGPGSYAFATLDMHDLKFVDVNTTLHNRKKYTNRTMVLKDANGKWFVHPLPTSSSILSMGLNDESDSRVDFAEVYKVEKAKDEKAKEEKAPGVKK